jgi:hypothetical protein
MDGKIILNWIIKKQGDVDSFNWLRIWPRSRFL